MKKKNDYLKFINYSIEQNEKMLKVNTDTIILGMFFDNLINKTVLDIGTNTGALLLYADYHKANKLIGVDINSESLEYAKRNISKYNKNFKLYNSRVQDLNIEPVDAIVCNPPFFEMNNVTIDEDLKDALFEEALPLDDLFKSYRRLLKDNGEIYMIYPADRFPELYNKCLEYKLKIMKMKFVHDTKKEYALRVLIKLKVGKMTKVRILKPIIVNNGEYEV